jgi:hypothetical protein
MPHYLNGCYAGHLAKVELDEAQTQIAIDIYQRYIKHLEQSKPSDKYPELIKRWSTFCIST